MSGIVERIPRVLQVIFGSVSDEISRRSGFIQRQRGFSGSEFVRALVFGWLGQPRASIEALADMLGITGSALQQRLTRQASECLQQVFDKALKVLLCGRPARIPLLAKFQGVYLEDCSTISLPDALADVFRGPGGYGKEQGSSSLRLFTCYELKTGTTVQVATAQSCGPDSVVAHDHAPKLPQGALRIRDMGFFDRRLFVKDEAAGVFWISRLPAMLSVRTDRMSHSLPISEFLLTQPAELHSLDCWLWVGQADSNGVEPHRCRFVAVRCAPEIAARRRQKLLEKARRKGRAATKRQLVMCDWTVLITNVPNTLLSFAEVWELYCARWQIEIYQAECTSSARLYQHAA